jgi:hypothetical protein
MKISAVRLSQPQIESIKILHQIFVLHHVSATFFLSSHRKGGEQKKAERIIN